MAAGVGLVPEDRRQQGLVMDFAIERNVTLASLWRVQRLGLIPPGAERRFAADWALRLRLRYGRLAEPGVDALRRQPAEGRAREVARPQAGGC